MKQKKNAKKTGENSIHLSGKRYRLIRTSLSSRSEKGQVIEKKTKKTPATIPFAKKKGTIPVRWRCRKRPSWPTFAVLAAACHGYLDIIKGGNRCCLPACKPAQFHRRRLLLLNRAQFINFEKCFYCGSFSINSGNFLKGGIIHWASPFWEWGGLLKYRALPQNCLQIRLSQLCSACWTN